MANYLALTAASKKAIELAPKFEESMLNIDYLRGRPDMELPQSIPRPKVDVEEMIIDTSPTFTVKVHIYRPSDSKNEILPAVFYIHGGGWALETKGSYSYVCSKIAGEARCAVIFIHYALSPEVRFPYAIEQCSSVLNWVASPENSTALKVDPIRFAIAGDSCGGNLAIAVSMYSKRSGLVNRIKHLVLFYPVTDDAFNTGSYYEFGTDYPLTRKHMQFFWDQYIPDKEGRKDILACPLKATTKEVKDSPPTLIISAEADCLRDEAENYGRKLLNAGVLVTTHRMLGVMHGFVTNAFLFSEETLIALDMATGALRRAFA